MPILLIRLISHVPIPIVVEYLKNGSFLFHEQGLPTWLYLMRKSIWLHIFSQWFILIINYPIIAASVACKRFRVSDSGLIFYHQRRRSIQQVWQNVINFVNHLNENLKNNKTTVEILGHDLAPGAKAHLLKEQCSTVSCCTYLPTWPTQGKEHIDPLCAHVYCT